jgi:GH25 family lysozyme M1 (1,4-beta-N-acetylmuramidase)
MCDEHALHFAEGIVKDVDGSTDIEVVSQSVEKQEKRKKTQRAGEKQALHV